MFQDALNLTDIMTMKEVRSIVAFVAIVLIKKQVEHELLAAFLELVVKLNETAFRPLLRRLCDWAFADESGKCMAPESVVICVLKCLDHSRLERGDILPSIHGVAGLLQGTEHLMSQVLC